ncbi:hypothetical protein XBKQ1_2780007 [Xenorhabdus bovienii str. kraussei Quebec]|uniref:Uncharacterized protein n=1 Tax=Xenorhabdus bovienii str. kraussei Quebec TaxID=1398203 RepID=A0A077PJF2_XENBV|nr:hypothetical protein XBKQ1_2780007 [Xenorhabdus bovienii str. kraussei Quebec]
MPLSGVQPRNNEKIINQILAGGCMWRIPLF